MSQNQNSLSASDPSFWVARKHGLVQSWHYTSRHAVKWMNDYADSINGWSITKSYTVTARYFNHAEKKWFPPELNTEHSTFPEAMDALAAWLHLMWEQDRANHPSPAGRAQAWERWNDVSALVNIASLTLLPNPGFRYRFGPLSPPEGKGHDLVVAVRPTSRAMLDSMVEKNRGCHA